LPTGFAGSLFPSGRPRRRAPPVPANPNTAANAPPTRAFCRKVRPAVTNRPSIACRGARQAGRDGPPRPWDNPPRLRGAPNMCRWLCYYGRPRYLESLLFEPENSLIHQSLHARQAVVTTNGDGFGIGWYGDREIPGVYHEVLPAWNDSN